MPQAGELLPVVGELAVDLVGDQVEIVLFGQAGQHLQLGGGVDGARRVAGVGDPDGASARRDELLDDGGGGQVEPLLGLRGDGHELRQGGLGERVVVRVEGFGDQQLVAGVADGHDGEPQRLAAAVGDVDVVALVGDVPGLVVGADGVAEVVVALRGRVGDGLHLEVPDGLEVLVGGLDVRLADVEVEDLFPLGLGLVGEGNEPADGRSLHCLDAVGKMHVRTTSSMIF